MKRVEVFAHRGASGYCPENTMPAFVKAIELGATGIETDVQMTTDGKLVLIHDESLKRTTGLDQLVKHSLYQDIRVLDAGSWYGAPFAGASIPLLEDLFDLVKSTNTLINVEIKNGIVTYPGIEQAVIDCIRLWQMTERVTISSFNHYSLVECTRIAPEIRTAILYNEGLYEPWIYAQNLGASALHSYKFATQPFVVEAAHAHGLTVMPFTLNNKREMQQMLMFGVDGIITDYPDVLLQLVR